MKDRTLLMIPGPIEFEPAVLQALGSPTTSHVANDFIEVFGKTLEMMKEVWLCNDGQPFILSGSGTLAMDSVAANLVEPKDKVLVISTGYFGERFKEIMKRYGAEVKILQAPCGGIITADQIENELKKDTYKLLTFTHVDTSTAVWVDPKPIGKLGQKYHVITILDGVCSIGGEEMKQNEWGIDVALTASQKAIGVPPGLALIMVGKKAMEIWRSRKTPVLNYYADWNNWLPIMEAYMLRKPSYFATPAVNHVCALHTSLKQLLDEGMEKRIARHRIIGKACRNGLKAMGLRQVPLKDENSASTLSAPYYPDGMTAKDILPKIKEAGIILAGGLLPEIKDQYFRIGHMGSSKAGDILATIGAIEKGLAMCNYKFEHGSGVAAAQSELLHL